MFLKLGSLTLALCGFGSLAFASLASAADLAPIPPPDETDWVFTVAPYGWAMGVSGNTSAGRSPTIDFDFDFSQILENLDAPPVMIVGEVRNGRFSISSDLIWAKLADEVPTPHGILASKIEGTLELTSWTGVVGYSLLYSGSGNLDAVIGARMWSVDIGVNLRGSGLLAGNSFGRGNTWVDPVVGLKGRADLTSNIYVAGWGLIGGFDVSSDKLMWDVMASVGYDFNDWFSMTVGYRGMGLDYQKNKLNVDTTFSGPLVGFVFTF